jgi:glycine cleavage system aminomethyltransferase T
VTLWDVGVERQVEITGPDAFDFTNMLVARDLAKCAVGQCKYVFVTAPDGGVINDPVLLRLGAQHFWLSLADSDVLLWALGVAHGSGLAVTIREADVGPVQIQGPKSKDVMVELFGASVLEVPYYFLDRYEVDGLPVLVSRTG